MFFDNTDSYGFLKNIMTPETLVFGKPALMKYRTRLCFNSCYHHGLSYRPAGSQNGDTVNTLFLS